jgi:hypothetical protein
MKALVSITGTRVSLMTLYALTHLVSVNNREGILNRLSEQREIQVPQRKASRLSLRHLN